ncbi:MAG: phenylalanine--tRNA ligase subunit beta [Burkholderiaceae bacterium]|nr:phenylalanine--tRNA ligase subunit beta [Burkholderiaceae bacterium]MCD8516329.1 phenylalanine--tRNA ligase subunit beta [Burkholderiaceae bacterium]MCD8538271.1 phenylalanine--tRNA ligase subunit beta [Burkholderiaceae bacterium]
MQFPESWLRAFVDAPVSTHELAEQLTMAGLEVEEVQAAAPEFSGVVIARIESVEPHPDADKLKVCQVNAGDQTLQIVCGAPNAAAGMFVPLAKVGAVLPGGLKIGKAKMRGVESAGMLCSAKELGLSQDHSGLMSLPDSLGIGADLRNALSLDESILTLKLTPNRADCLSILGVAREVAALNDIELKDMPVPSVPVTLADRLSVKVQATDLCGRFTGRVVRGVNARAQTPRWMLERLERAGQRSVSALVDISNYLMLERGRPTHVFDLDKMTAPELTVRWAEAGESLKLLNGETIELTPAMGVITAGDHIESLAGIMGGDETAVSLETQNIYIEAAFWWPDAIAGRARQLKLTSEAAHRFERGVDFANITDDLERLTALVLEICGGQAGPIDDQALALPERKPVAMRLERCQKVLGMTISADQVESVFERLGFDYSSQDDVFIVTPPSHRFDLKIEEDLIEEVARMVGFDNIPVRPPVASAKMFTKPEGQRNAHALRQIMVDRDYQEVINFSFVDRQWETDRLGVNNPIELANPIASQMSVMRTSLLPSLVANVVYNANRRQSRVRVFEIGRVFLRDSDVKSGDLNVAGITQPVRIAGAAWGPAVREQWGLQTRQVDFFDVKRDVEILFGQKFTTVKFSALEHPLLHPGRSARIMLDDKECGMIGELHPKWVRADDLQTAPVLFELDVEGLSYIGLPQPHTLSKQPVVQRDMALWVNADIAVGQILDTISSTIAHDPDLSVVIDTQLFDVWRPKPDSPEAEQGDVSLAFRFWMQDPEVTLEDERVERCLSAIRQALESTHGVRQR